MNENLKPALVSSRQTGKQAFMAEAWTGIEIDLIVANYFAMLIEELYKLVFDRTVGVCE
jgi:hypothetical protein